ncbi:nucleotidyltransferase family protein [Flavobacterium sp. RSP15]|uniref:nucleotidyltransferase family protein n=1 Tax=Flavobacterium sp. RSP15 TaxID=2497485 RepID=UPI000F821C61|nr:nucleotidyltransferase family protein [Flavobacterium sp. RSP15]RTY88678.1 nucleotidyltransferase family protein [Flavobacterium sp. RSP15]
MENKTGIVLLAAGGSSRLGRPKQLLEFNGKTLLFHTVEQILEVSTKAIVIMGSKNTAIEKEVDSVLICRNPDWQKGMGSSISKGLEELLLVNLDIEHCILAVCDQPHIDAAVFRSLIEKHKKTGKGIIASSYANTMGTPVLFSRKYFTELMQLSGNAGARKMIEKYKKDVDSIPFEKGAVDIDTIEDYEQLIHPK